MTALKIAGITILVLIFLLLAIAAIIYKSIMWPKITKIGSGPVQVSCIGDSITFGQGVFMHRGKWSYEAFLSKILGPEYTFVNYGLTNRTLLPVGNHYYFKEKIGKTAWNTKADILIFMLGTNDSKQILWDAEQFENEYKKVLEHYQQMQSFQQIYIMIPPKVFDSHPGKRDCNNLTIINEAAPIIRRTADTCGVNLIDLYSLTKDHREWFPDKLHPNKDGNRAIAEEIARCIRAEAAKFSAYSRHT